MPKCGNGWAKTTYQCQTLSTWFSHAGNLKGVTNSDLKVTNITRPGEDDGSWCAGCLALKGLGINVKN